MATRKLFDLLVGLPLPEGDMEGNASHQGVWAEGETRHKRATGSPGLLGTSSALHSLKAANIVASWKEGVRRGCGQGLQGIAPDLRSTCVWKHRGSSPEKKIYLRTIVLRIYLFWEFRGEYYLGFESKSPGSICRALKEQVWPKAFKIWLIKAQGGLDFLFIAPQTHNRDLLWSTDRPSSAPSSSFSLRGSSSRSTSPQG